MKDKCEETRITDKIRNIGNEIAGLERKLGAETDPDKQTALQRELNQAKRDLIEAEGELLRLAM